MAEFLKLPEASEEPGGCSVSHQEAAARASKVLAEGGLVIFPTESFYGLGVDPFNREAVRRLFDAKGRAPEKPVLLLIPSADSIRLYCKDVPSDALRLMEAFWPGPLTIVFHATDKVLPELTAGTGKIGLRLSASSFARLLCSAFGEAVTGTSANYSMEPPCSKAMAAYLSLRGRVDLVVDGGDTPGGSASTVVDVTESPPRLLRHGLVKEEEIIKVLEEENYRSLHGKLKKGPAYRPHQRASGQEEGDNACPQLSET